ncbi:ROK family protein [Streptomyces sp. NPDC055025]
MESPPLASPISGVVISYLGIDIGGTKVALRAEGEGRSSQETSFRWPSPANVTADVAADVTANVTADLAALTTHVAALRERWEAPFTSVGVAVPATLDGSGRVVVWPGRPVWEGLQLRRVLGDLFPEAAVGWADDGDLAAIAEADRAGCRDVVYLGVGTGIGGGMVLDGRSVPGPARGSAELGHMIVDASGARCDCGRTGCVQAMASGPATLRRAGELKGEPVAFDELRSGLAAGEPWAVSSVEASCAALGAAVISLCELVRPELVLIGGGFATGLPGFVDTVAAHTRRLSRPGTPAPRMAAAALGGLSSLHGALLLARREGSA